MEYPQRKGSRDEGTSECFLTHHTVVSTLRQRLVLGYEKMLCQGFADFATDGTDMNGKALVLNDSDLNLLAGNTIAVPIISCLQLVLFTNVLFMPSKRFVPAEQLEFGLPPRAIRIGSIGRPNCRYDRLLCSDSH